MTGKKAMAKQGQRATSMRPENRGLACSVARCKINIALYTNISLDYKTQRIYPNFLRHILRARLIMAFHP